MQQHCKLVIFCAEFNVGLDVLAIFFYWCSGYVYVSNNKSTLQLLSYKKYVLLALFPRFVTILQMTWIDN